MSNMIEKMIPAKDHKSEEQDAVEQEEGGSPWEVRLDPTRLPTRTEMRQQALDRIRAEIIKNIDLDPATIEDFWNRFRYDDKSGEVRVRPEYKGVLGVEKVRMNEDYTIEEVEGPDHDPSPFEIPNPFAPPKPKRG